MVNKSALFNCFGGYNVSCAHVMSVRMPATQYYSLPGATQVVVAIHHSLSNGTGGGGGSGCGGTEE